MLTRHHRAAGHLPAPSRCARPHHAWAKLPDDKLLNLRLCDLSLKLKGTWVQRCVQRLHAELEAMSLRFRPHVWLSSEWFSPDGVPGIAIPFYLVHPRLKKLEEKQMLDVEGGSQAQCMRILRHEAGHSIDTAFRLHHRKRWRQVFGLYSTAYPNSYRPKPDSRQFVLHLDSWYAQAHPAEDFAETFAVWLTPNARWQQRYRGWPAMHKLQYVDKLMGQIAGTRPVARSRRYVESLSQLRTTLRQHYRRKRMRYSDEWPQFYDADLRRLFSSAPKFDRRPTAASFLRRIRPELRQIVAAWTGTHPYAIDQVLRDMIDRCRELRLRLALPQRDATVQAMIMVTVQTMNYIHAGHYRVAL